MLRLANTGFAADSFFPSSFKWACFVLAEFYLHIGSFVVYVLRHASTLQVCFRREYNGDERRILDIVIIIMLSFSPC